MKTQPRPAPTASSGASADLRRAHIVADGGAATSAAVHGTSVPTLCGIWMTPTRDPRSVPRCEPCLAILERLGVAAPG